MFKRTGCNALLFRIREKRIRVLAAQDLKPEVIKHPIRFSLGCYPVKMFYQWVTGAFIRIAASAPRKVMLLIAASVVPSARSL